MRRRGRAWGWVVSLGMLGACSDKKATAIVVSVSTEARIPTEIEQVEIVVERDGQPRFSQPYMLPDDTRLPGTLTLTRDDDSKSPAHVTIRAKDKGAKGWRVVREARVGFSEEKTKLLRMPLRFACFDAADCGDGKTCIGGDCKDATVDAETLPDFTGNEGLIRTRAEGGCFDEAKCVEAWEEIPESAVDSDCSFAAPGKIGSFNVLVEWSTSQGRRIVLDPDDKEGFTINGSRVVLAPGICKALTGQPGARAKELGISKDCPTKTADAPVCLDGQSPVAAAGGAGGAGGAAGAAGKAGGGGGTVGGGGTAGTGGAAGATSGAGGAAGSSSTVVTGPDASKATIPPGASSQASSVTITVASAGSYPALPSTYTGGNKVYAYTPHGLTFSSPVAIDVPGASAFSTPVLLTTPPGGPWTEVAATQNGDLMQANVNHFSFFTVATPASGSGGGAGAAGSGGAGGATAGAAGAGGGCGDVQSSATNCGECGYSCGAMSCKFGICQAVDLNIGGGARAIVTADGKTYVASLFGNNIVTSPDTGVPAGGMPTEVAKVQRPYALLVDGSYVYWHTTPGELGRISRATGVSEKIGQGPAFFDLSGKHQGSIVLDGQTFYFTHIDTASQSTGIWSLPASGGTAAQLITQTGQAPEPIIADATHLYWARQDGVVLRAPKGSLNDASVETVGTIPGGGSVRALAEDGNDLLASSNDTLYRFPKTGGMPTVVTQSKYAIYSATLVVHAGQVFFGNSGGRLEHVPLTGGTPHSRCDASAPVQLFFDGTWIYFPSLSGTTYRCDSTL